MFQISAKGVQKVGKSIYLAFKNARSSEVLQWAQRHHQERRNHFTHKTPFHYIGQIPRKSLDQTPGPPVSCYMMCTQFSTGSFKYNTMP